MSAALHRIGDLCNLVRGTSATLKTPPGDYPLVVTAEFRRSADTWQLEGPAVCVPLISSTGHGDAALHRVHYQEGRFALANLLVALLPKDSATVNAKYLYHYLLAKKDALFVPLMLGTANVSLKECDVRSVSIPLPPLHEQQRVVSTIGDISEQLTRAYALQDKVTAEADELCRALLRDPSSQATALGDLVKLRTPDVKVQAEQSYHFAGVYSFGRGVFVGNTKAGTEFAYPRLTRLRTGDFVYPKLMAWEGAFGIVPPECDGLVVSTEFPVFDINRDRVLPEVLDVYFRNPALWPSIGGASTGTNVRRRRLSPQDFLNLTLPVPPMHRQRLLAETYAAVQEVKARQRESKAMLDALLPAILDHAFAGAL